MRTIPDAALPPLPSALGDGPTAAREETSEVSDATGIVTARDVSTAPPGVTAEIMTDFSGRSRDRTCDFVRVKDALYR